MQVTDEMVTRFLGWRLPDTFAPDCYISFNREGVKKMGNGTHWPVGTNLLTADEARAMLEHVLDDRPMQPTYYVQHPDGTYSKADPQPVSANYRYTDDPQSNPSG